MRLPVHHLIALGMFCLVPVQLSPQVSDIKPILQIGSDFGDETTQFHRITDIAVADDGSIYVLDGGNLRVAAYDRSGRFVMYFGGEGYGPGEFIRPLTIRVDSLVRVFDGAQRRVSTFSPDGDHLEMQSLPSPGDLYITFIQELAHDNFIGVTTASFSPGSPSHDPNATIVAFRPETADIDTLSRSHSVGVLWYDSDQLLPWGVEGAEFGAGGDWAVYEDSLLAVVNGYAGEVTWYRADRSGVVLTHVADLGVDGSPITENDLDLVERAIRADRDRPLGEITLVPPPEWSAVIDALFAENGELWVSIREPRADGDSNRWFILPTDGRQSRAVTLPNDFYLKVVRGAVLYGLSSSDLDSPVVQVYKLSSSPLNN